MVLPRLRRIGDRPIITRHLRRRGITTIRLRRRAMLLRRIMAAADRPADNMPNHQKVQPLVPRLDFFSVCTVESPPNGIKPVANIGFR